MEIKQSKNTINKLSGIVPIVLFCFSYFLYIQHVGLSYPNALIDGGSMAVFLIPTVFLIRHIQSYFHSRSPLNIANISFVVMVSGISLLASHYISINLIHSDYKQADILRYAFIPKGIAIVFVLFIVLIYYWSKQQAIVLSQFNERQLEKEREAIKIQLNSLQQQFQPHFLFNSLNSINALTITNPSEAQKMIHKLSEFMRGAVRENQSDLITLDEEIKHLQLYTDIEKIRFGDRLIVSYAIPKGLLSQKLPHLILQPIIENAIKYGLYGNIDAVEIKIEVKKIDNAITISIQNPFDLATNTSKKGTGYGLLSIEKKMQILYKRSNLLTTHKSEGVFTTVLTVPQA